MTYKFLKLSVLLTIGLGIFQAKSNPEQYAKRILNAARQAGNRNITPIKRGSAVNQLNKIINNSNLERRASLFGEIITHDLLNEKKKASWADFVDTITFLEKQFSKNGKSLPAFFNFVQQIQKTRNSTDSSVICSTLKLELEALHGALSKNAEEKNIANKIKSNIEATKNRIGMITVSTILAKRARNNKAIK